MELYTQINYERNNTNNNINDILLYMDKNSRQIMKYISPITNKEVNKAEYFEIMFGKEFMKSKDKGTLKEYKV